jgi:hypothetical protein
VTAVTHFLVLGIWVMRILAAVAGVLVALDSLRILAGDSERPPHDARRNAWAWAWIGTGCLFGSVSFLLFGFTYYAIGTGQTAQDFAVLGIWIGLATGLTIRAASRAEQPRLIYLSVTLFLLAAAILAVCDRAPV